MQGGRDPFLDFGVPFGSLDGSGDFGGPIMKQSSFRYLNLLCSPAHCSSMDEKFCKYIDFLPFERPVIEELNSDGDKEENESDKKKLNSRKHGRLGKEPIVDDPDDEAAASGSTQGHQNPGGCALPSTERSINAEGLKPEFTREAEWPHLRKSIGNDATGSSGLGSNGSPRHEDFQTGSL